MRNLFNVVARKRDAKRSRYESVFVQHLYVDHDLANGQVRSLLCNRCNVAIAFLKEDPRIVDAAAEYLRKHNEVLVLGVPRLLVFSC